MDVRKEVSCWDKLFDLHKDYTALKTKYTDHSSEQFLREKRIAKANWETRYRIPGTTGGSYSAVANLTGETWNLIGKIFKGQLVTAELSEKFRAPNGLTYFKSFSNVPIRKVDEWLNRVLHGTFGLKEFSDACTRYKIGTEIQTGIVDYVNNFYHRRFSNYSALVKEYPCLDDEQWFRGMHAWSGKTAKERFTAQMQMLVRERIQKYLESEKNPVVSNCSVFYCVVFFNRLYIYICMNFSGNPRHVKQKLENRIAKWNYFTTVPL